ncbi:unnamed protein product [Paramecium sonneborni]|uniref:Uncharacterized protein n=1 Tax=Paramecium sonneborni TaxID=65129 RepID=A0A8S1KP77_9CILI|nr:unnamed protein product [Paramecium sonneborni]
MMIQQIGKTWIQKKTNSIKNSQIIKLKQNHIVVNFGIKMLFYYLKWNMIIEDQLDQLLMIQIFVQIKNVLEIALQIFYKNQLIVNQYISHKRFFFRSSFSQIQLKKKFLDIFFFRYEKVLLEHIYILT